MPFFSGARKIWAHTRKSFTGAKIILDLEQTLNVRVAAESGWDGFALSCFRLLLPERHPIL